MTRKNFCLYPFAAFSIDNPGRPRICCNNNAWDRVAQNKKFGDPTFTIENDFNNPLHKELRKFVIEDQRHPSCQKCWDTEDEGYTSYRNWFSDSFKHSTDEDYWINKCDPDGTINDFEFIYVDITFGNKCNLKCVMCSGYNSTSIAKEQFEQKEIPVGWYNNLMSFNWFEDQSQFEKLYPYLKHVQRIHILGGEPLLIEHQYFLQKFVDLGIAKNIKLSYNSNLTTLPREILETWKEFEVVTLCISVDAYGPLNEFIRFPMRWSKLERNIEELDQIQGNIILEIHATFGALNYVQFTTFLEWVKEMAAKYDRLDTVPFFNYIYSPEEFDPTCLPENIKQIGYDKFMQWESNNKDLAVHERIQMLKGIYTKVLESESDKTMWEKCLKKIKYFETIRNITYPGFN